MSLEYLEQKIELKIEANKAIGFKNWDSRQNSVIMDQPTINSVVSAIQKDSSSFLAIYLFGVKVRSYPVWADSAIKLLPQTKENFIAILKSLKSNRHLIKLSLDNLTINTEEAEILRDILIQHPSLKIVHINKVTFGSGATTLIAEGIKKNKPLSALHLYFCEFQKNEVKEIDAAFANNHFINFAGFEQIYYPKDHNAAYLGADSPISKSIDSSTERNRAFRKQHTLLEENFLLLKKLNILPKYFKEEQSSFLHPDPVMWKELSEKADKKAAEINQKSDEEKTKTVISLLEGTLDIVDTLKAKGYVEWPNLLKRAKRVVAKVYSDFGEIDSFIDLYLNYSMFHEATQLDFSFAEKILTCNENNEKDKHLLGSLRLDDLDLRRQYVLRLLKNPDAQDSKIIYQTAYCNIHQLPNPSSSNTTFEKTIGVDAILMHSDLDRLSRVLNGVTATTVSTQKGIDDEDSDNEEEKNVLLKDRQKKVYLDKNDSGEETEFDVDSENEKEEKKAKDISFKDFYQFFQENYFSTGDKKEAFLKSSAELAKKLKTPNEQFAAQIFLAVFTGKKVTFYTHLAEQKVGKPIKILNFENDSKGEKTLNIGKFVKSHEKQNKEFNTFNQKVSLNYNLVQNLGEVYNRIFHDPSAENITWDHSRILSAERLVTISSDLNYDQLKTILQVEYAALPDDDKRATASFFTCYRHRTLEKALEKVFEKEGIQPLKKDAIEGNENLLFACKILQWIGDQERGFYYKASKNPRLFMHLQKLGELAHSVIVGNKKVLATSKENLKKGIQILSSLVDTKALADLVKENLIAKRPQ